MSAAPGSGDGLSESFNTDRRALSSEGIERLLQPRFDAAGEIVDTLMEGEKTHRGEADPHDDLTIFVLARR